MNTPRLAAILAATAAIVGLAAPTAYAGRSPGIDDTYTIYSCPFPIQVHETYNAFNEVFTPHEVQDHRLGWDVTLTNLDTGATWRVKGNVVSRFVDNPDGSLTQTVDGVWPALGPLHTVYVGHWTRTFPDGIQGPVPFEGHGQTFDVCQQLS